MTIASPPETPRRKGPSPRALGLNPPSPRSITSPLSPGVSPQFACVGTAYSAGGSAFAPGDPGATGYYPLSAPPPIARAPPGGVIRQPL